MSLRLIVFGKRHSLHLKTFQCITRVNLISAYHFQSILTSLMKCFFFSLSFPSTHSCDFVVIHFCAWFLLSCDSCPICRSDSLQLPLSWYEKTEKKNTVNKGSLHDFNFSLYLGVYQSLSVSLSLSRSLAVYDDRTHMFAMTIYYNQMYEKSTEKEKTEKKKKNTNIEERSHRVALCLYYWVYTADAMHTHTHIHTSSRTECHCEYTYSTFIKSYGLCDVLLC